MNAGPTATAIAAALLARRPAYAPDLRPQPDGPAGAVIAIAAEYLEALGERVGRMPDKHLAALLDMAGVSLLAPQPASAPVVFTALPGAPASRVLSGTRLGASLPGRAAPLPFETREAVAVTSSALAEVWTVVPGSDTAGNHGPDLAAGRGATLFAGAQRVERQLILGDPVRLALTGRAEILLDVTLRAPGTASLSLVWSWWDGSTWQPFADLVDPAAAGDDDSWDATAGLTRSGRIRLVAPCAQAKPLTIEGIESCWIRARTTVALPPRPDVRPPEIARLELRTVLSRAPVQMTLARSGGALAPPAVRVRIYDEDSRSAAGAKYWTRSLTAPATEVSGTFQDNPPTSFTLPGATTFALAITETKPDAEDYLRPITLAEHDDLEVSLARRRGLPADKAIADDKPVDVTRAFQPLGQSPMRGAAFYVACDDVFAKPGARVSLSLSRPQSAGEEADAIEDIFRGTVQSALGVIEVWKAFLGNAADGLEKLLDPKLGALGEPLDALLVKGTSTFSWYQGTQGQVAAALTFLVDCVKKQMPLFETHPATKPQITVVAAEIGTAIANLVPEPARSTIAGAAADAARAAGGQGNLDAAYRNLITAVDDNTSNTGGFLDGVRPSYLLEDPETFRKAVADRLEAAKAAVGAASASLRAIIDQFGKLDVPGLVRLTTGDDPPGLTTPNVVWEYWDGSRWHALAITGADATRNLGATGVIRFDVPEGWEPKAVLNDERRWLRARLDSGSFSHLRFVTWTDAKSGLINVLPVVEPRPPILDAVAFFFHYESPPAPPAQALRQNDFQWEDVTPQLAAPGPGFAPFRPMPDRSPTLYLGFDGPLPADRLGLFVVLQEPDPDAQPLAVTWEGYDGSAWRTLAADDATRGLTAHGIVGLLWPGDASPAGAAVLGATGRSVQLADRDGAARFAAGDRVLVRDPRGGEAGVVVAAQGDTLTVRDPISRAYVGGEVIVAPPARFGTPRTWIRARFDASADPPPVAVAALLMNATDAWQTESIAAEITGSSDGSPRQVMFVHRPPILEDETVEVRELDGQRAPVDLPILERELAASGLAGAASVTRDPRSGAITEVWVRWAMRPSLGLSGSGDRHYAVDRGAGRILFGDGVNGRIPPAAPDNIRVSYRSGGGSDGNVGAGAISALISAVPASRVGNPLAAGGGSDGELLDAALTRGPTLLRHRRMALTTEDAADLARETCPAVARARAIGARDEYGRPLPGHTRVIVIPDIDGPRPQPDAELCRRVHDGLAVRAPATGAPGIVVVGPDYVPVGASVTVRAALRAEPGIVRTAVLTELERFLHPLRGGRAGTGFDFGRSVFLSDLARTLEAVDGVDVVTEVALTRDGIEQGERVDVQASQLVCAGPLSVTLAGAGA
jgi:predicted phage baseplate assembly protein